VKAGRDSSPRETPTGASLAWAVNQVPSAPLSAHPTPLIANSGTEHQANNWRRREFRPVVLRVATDYPQFSDIGNATPYATRHTFISCCLQAGVSLATVAQWCGTSIQMISATYGRMIQRHEEAPPVRSASSFERVWLRPCHCFRLLRASPRRRHGVGPQGRFRTPRRSRVGPQVGLWARNCLRRSAGKRPFSRAFGEIAQLVEHTTENRGVLGSIPSLAIFKDACTWLGFGDMREAV
jgi:hypothetical protein